jgi:lipid-binding SYLF domain-containing protein
MENTMMWMQMKKALLLVAVLSFGPSLGQPVALASDESNLKELVERSRTTLENFMTDSNMGWFREHLGDARGIMIVPRMWKGGFIVAGEGGTGVFLVKDDKTGEWSQPAFYRMGTASGGLQAGLQVSEIVLLVMSQRGVESLLTSTFKLGADASVAVGPVGAGIEGSTAVLSVDILTFARAKGLFGGISLEGAVIATGDESIRIYYGKSVRPTDILVKHNVSNAQSTGLRAALGRAASGKSASDQSTTPTPN